MGLIEDFRQKRKQEEEKEKSDKKVTGPSLGQIMKDPKQVALFGMYLENEGAHDLFVKFNDREYVETFDEEMQGRLAGFREGFLETTQRAAETVKMLDAKSLNEIISMSPELKTIADLNGADNIRKIIAEYLPELAVRNPKDFEGLSNAIKILSERKAEIAEDEKKIGAFCRKYGISQKEYAKMIEEGDTEGLADLVRDEVGMFKKIFSRQARRDRDAEINEIVEEDDIKKHIDELNEDFSRIGKLLGGVLGDNGTFARALTADLRGDSIEKKEPEMPFSEVDRLGGTDDEIKQAWGRYLSANGIDDEDFLDGFDHSLHVSEFERQYQNNLLKKNKGFWASVGSLLCGKKINKLISWPY